ncbi:hypothetical protein BGZ83_005039 [Gryganskiella cystojenkinii]|nr:hypothetical protein BGZ83_005039 [Gryganskiella cystojenkinii]
MLIILITSLIALASGVFADVTYNVIAFPDTLTDRYAVEIDKRIFPLQKSDATSPLWTGKVTGVSASSYRYVQLNHKNDVIARENFLRDFTNKDATATPNEFFNRKTTITNLPSIKQVYKDVRPKPSKAFDSSQIATIHLTADPKLVSDLFNHPMDREHAAISVGFKFINADTVYSVNQVELKISGKASRKYKKVSMRLKFDENNGETFFDRPVIKLRAEYTEPTMLRERLYLDVLNSAGVVSTQGSYVRVFVNGKPHGFYLMLEDMAESFFMTTVHRGTIKNKETLGSLYQMGSGGTATLAYNGPLAVNYSPKIYENKFHGDDPKDEPMKRFISFMKDLQDWDPAAPGGLTFWNQRLDLESYLHSMAIEYLTASGDGYWWNGHNYLMYFNPQRNVWQFIPTDFDHTFSDGNRPDVDTTYKEFAQSRMKQTATVRPLVSKLILQNKDINKQFETILRTITQMIFNNEALDARIDAYEKQIQEDVAWDYSIDRSNLPGNNLGWTIADFHNAIKGPAKGFKRGIKPWIAYRAKSVTTQVGNRK